MLPTRYMSIALLFLCTFLNAQWTTLPFNTGYQNHALYFVNKDTGYVSNGIWQGPPPGTNHTKLFKTTDGGTTWQTIVDDYSNTPICQLHFLNENVGFYRRWQDNILKTTNGGASGTSLLSAGSSSAGDKFQIIDSLQYMYAANNKVYYTLNGGSSWVNKSTLAYQAFFNGSLYTQFTNLKEGFVYGSVQVNTPSFHTEFAVYKTSDSAQTLQPSFYASKPNASFHGIKFVNPTTAILLFDNLVLRTQDFGSNWDTVYTLSPSESAYALDIKNNLVLISGNYGTVLTSTNGGLTFQSQNIGSAILSLCIADANSGVVYGMCNNTIVKLGSIATGVKDKQPEKLTIDCYPNPSPGTITLKFSQKRKEDQTIEIFDITGSLVHSSTLLSTEQLTDNLDIGFLQNGYYVLKIWSKTQTDHIKVLKQ